MFQKQVKGQIQLQNKIVNIVTVKLQTVAVIDLKLGKKVPQETQHPQRTKPTTARQQTEKRERETKRERERKKVACQKLKTITCITVK